MNKLIAITLIIKLFCHESDFCIDEIGNSMIHAAAAFGEEEAIEKMLDDYDTKNCNDKTAKDIAEEIGYLNISEALKEHYYQKKCCFICMYEPDDNQKARWQATFECKQEHPKVAHKECIEKLNLCPWCKAKKLPSPPTAPTNMHSYNRRRYPHSAVFSENSSMLATVLSRGFSTQLTNGFGNTPLHMAVLKNRPDLVNILLRHRADPNAKNQVGDTPLHLVKQVPIEPRGWFELLLCSTQGDDRYNLEEITRSLLNWNAGLQIPNNNDETPLGLALNNQYPEHIKAIIIRKYSQTRD